jgi:HEAT repeats
MRPMNRRILFVVATALAFAAGCGGEPRGPVLSGGREVKSWLAALRDPKPRVRRQAALKLGNVGDVDPSVAEALAEALRDSDPLVRREAVLAVAKLTKPNGATIAQLEAMSRSDRDPSVRDFSKRAVTHFGGVP